jgi:hypothetical protein
MKAAAAKQKLSTPNLGFYERLKKIISETLAKFLM